MGTNEHASSYTNQHNSQDNSQSYNNEFGNNQIHTGAVGAGGTVFLLNLAQAPVHHAAPTHAQPSFFAPINTPSATTDFLNMAKHTAAINKNVAQQNAILYPQLTAQNNAEKKADPALYKLLYGI